MLIIKSFTIDGLPAKTTPVDADEIALSDSAAANALKKNTLTNFKAYLKSYFDTLYSAVTLASIDADYATTAAMPAGTDLAGVYTATATGVVAVDGHNLAVGDRLLRKNETGASQPFNGVYTVTVAGAVGVALVMTRAVDMNQPNEFNGALVLVLNGTANGGTFWKQTATIVTVGTDNVTFTQLNLQLPAITGDVSIPAGGTVSTIGANIVTNAKLAQAGAKTLKGNPTAGTANEQDTTAPTVSGEMTASDFNASGLTGAVSASRYVGATASGAPVAGTFAIGDFIVAQNGHIFVCTVAGTPGTWTDVGSVSNLVTSVFTRTGAVVATNGDYNGVVAAALTGATAATRYVGGTASAAPASGTFAVGDFVISQTGHVFICTTAGTPGTWTDAGSVGNLVSSVFGRTGSVVATSGDYTAAQVTNAADKSAASAQNFSGIVGFNKGANLASANNLAPGADGNLFHVTGTTQINLISSTNVQAGAVIALIFDSTPLVKHNQTVSGANKPILLLNGVDWTPAANDTLELWYDGTSFYDIRRGIQTSAAFEGINSQSGTTYTLAATDIGQSIEFSSNSAITLTFPQDSAVTIPIGAIGSILPIGTGAITFAAGTGATIQVQGGKTKSNEQYGPCFWKKRAANTFVITGDVS